ncbi:MAG: FAD synthase [Natronomonas sp.]
MTRVVAQGTFDLLHPGHLHYLREAASMGEELHVIVARRDNVTHKPKPIVGDRQRLEMVSALDPVDAARLGDREDFRVPIKAIDPDVLVLGHDQHHEESTVSEMLESIGVECRIVRASPRPPEETTEEMLSTGRIIDRICERRC